MKKTAKRVLDGPFLVVQPYHRCLTLLRLLTLVVVCTFCGDDNFTYLALDDGVPTLASTEAVVRITVIDDTAPVMTCPSQAASIEFLANESCVDSLPDFVFDDTVVVHGICEDQTMHIDQIPIPDTALHLDSLIQVSVSVADMSGNVASCSFSVILVDKSPPSIARQSETIVVSTDDQCSGTIGDVTGKAAVIDNCDNSPSVAQDVGVDTILESVDLDNPVTVTLTATDPSSNQARCKVTSEHKDLTLPLISCPSEPVAVTPDATCSGVVGDLVPRGIATDNCGSPLVEQDVDVNESMDLYIGVTVSLTAKDGSGNSATCSLSTVLKDPTQPDIACPEKRFVTADENCPGFVDDFANEIVSGGAVLDNCDASPAVVQDIAPGTLLALSVPTTVQATATDSRLQFDDCSGRPHCSKYRLRRLFGSICSDRTFR